ncbi:MAG: ATP-grasp domain-containing protein [Acidimicrobiales bacterium]|nr:ATP-grasp domain-containing protein [Acidimicrobiales bacterium]
MKEIRKLLVANRGEIACRIMRTASEMGIPTVALYSDPDTNALHVRCANEAFHLPGSSPAETYLNMDRILEACQITGADAIHPGYGFLSENAQFAKKVEEANITFVGPTASSIETMGSKLSAKELVESFGVPTLKSANLTDLTSDRLSQVADEIGYPLLIKASSGGGGRGMRIVENNSQLQSQVDAAKREALSAFGDATVFAERYLENPRHIEIQVFGDSHGNIVSLFERECSIQRRHQKIVEEAPSSAITPELRHQIGEVAVNAAKSVNYLGAGTVEFLLSGSNEFFFLEMNTRLQVEHPVTELITGLDLVRLQIEVAQGEKLPLDQIPSEPQGHAIEVRLYAEDSLNEWMPSAGDLDLFEINTDNVRLDTGYQTGDTVPISYDSMLAKVISYSSTRAESAKKLARALREFSIAGVTTNRDLLAGILTEEEFLEGKTDTGYLQRHLPQDLSLQGNDAHRYIDSYAIAAALCLQFEERRRAKVLRGLPSGWRNLASAPQHYEFLIPGSEELFEITYLMSRDGGIERVTTNGNVIADVKYISGNEGFLDLSIGGVRSRFAVLHKASKVHVQSVHGTITFEIKERFIEPGSLIAPGSMIAPMPGTVSKIMVELDQIVEVGEILLTMEAMKMEHTITAPARGKVVEVDISEGSQVSSGQVLVVLEEIDGEET